MLGIEPTDDKAAIKKAYARLLRQHNPEDDPVGFMRLREAYEAACKMAESEWFVVVRANREASAESDGETPAEPDEDVLPEDEYTLSEEEYALPEEDVPPSAPTRVPEDAETPVEPAEASAEVPNDGETPAEPDEAPVAESEDEETPAKSADEVPLRRILSARTGEEMPFEPEGAVILSEQFVRAHVERALRDLYDDFRARITVKRWQELFRAFSLREMNAAYTLAPHFFNEHPCLPHAVWLYLNEEFSLNEDPAFRWQEILHAEELDFCTELAEFYRDRRSADPAVCADYAVLCLRAYVAARRGAHEEVLSLAREAADLLGWNSALLLLLSGDAHFALGDAPWEAADAYKAYLLRRPDDDASRFNRAVALFSFGEYTAALMEFQQLNAREYRPDLVCDRLRQCRLRLKRDVGVSKGNLRQCRLQTGRAKRNLKARRNRERKEAMRARGKSRLYWYLVRRFLLRAFQIVVAVHVVGIVGFVAYAFISDAFAAPGEEADRYWKQALAHDPETGDSPDAAKAFSAASRLAELDDARGQKLLGDYYAAGIGVKADGAQARDWYQKSVDNGNTGAYVGLGRLYLYGGSGLRQNTRSAISCFTEAARYGHAEGMFYLSVLYGERVDVRRDPDKALLFLRGAAAKDFPEALLHLGIRYENGRDVAANEDVARTYYERAAGMGSVEADMRLARLCEKRGDVWGAFVHYEKVFADSAAARTGLGWLYKNGLGVERDYKRAASLFEDAASGGDSEAFYHLAFLYAEGLGVPKDTAQAAQLLTNAIQRKLDEEIAAAREKGDRARERRLRDEGMLAADLLRALGENREKDLPGAIYALTRLVEADEGVTETVVYWYKVAGELGSEESARWLREHGS
jgi:TPR repeat protein